MQAVIRILKKMNCLNKKAHYNLAISLEAIAKIEKIGKKTGKIAVFFPTSDLLRQLALTQ